MKTPDTVLPATEERKHCCKCAEPAVRIYGRSHYCARHIRFLQMRAGAKITGKLVPTYAWLEASVPDGMVCPCCRRQMNWLAGEGHSTVITLQHDRSGELRLICHACNVRHSQMPGDSFYDLPEGHKRCPKCAETKPLGEFYREAKGGISTCKVCDNAKCRAQARARTEADREVMRAKKNARRAANLEEARAKERAYRQANKEKVSAGMSAYRKDNQEAIRAQRRGYWESNREKINARKREQRALKKLNLSHGQPQ